MHPVLLKMEILKPGISALKTGLNLHFTFENSKKCRCQERKFEEPQICGLNGMEMEFPIDSILLCFANSGSPKTFDFESSINRSKNESNQRTRMQSRKFSCETSYFNILVHSSSVTVPVLTVESGLGWSAECAV